MMDFLYGIGTGLALVGWIYILKRMFFKNYTDTKITAMYGQMPRSPHWGSARKAFLDTHPTCEACGSNKDLNVHHEKPFHKFPKLELEPSNFITLCEGAGNCHFIFGHLKSWLSFNENVREDAAHFLKELKGRP